MLDIHAHGDVVELRLNRPPANALNHALLEALLSARREAIDGGARGLILSGREGMFCAGIDVKELLDCDRASMSRFWALFFDAARALLTCPIPVVAAVTGHSPAGGTVLAINCDYRVAAEGRFKIGLNEVQVGLTLPPPFMHVFADLVGPRKARQLAAKGALMPMSDAFEIGLVDEMVAGDRVLEAALSYLDGLLRLPLVAMNETRLIGKQRLVSALEETDDVERATNAWFSDETRQAMQALADSLKKD